MRLARPPRVLQVIDSLYPGGAERVLPVLAAELARSQDAASIVRVVGSGDNADPLIEGSIRAHAEDFGFTGAQTMYDPGLVRALGRVIRERRIDVVHSHLNISNVASRIAAALTGVPHVTTVHTPPGRVSGDALHRMLADGVTARLSTRIVGVSPHTAQAFAKAFGVPQSRIRVIPNGTVPRRPAPGFERDRKRRELTGMGGEARVVLCAARLDPIKGIGDLVQATQVLRQRVPDLNVLIAGQGSDRARLEDMVRSADLGGTVKVLGFRDDMGDLLASADVLCLPSYVEGLSMSLLEAMHAGVPCVATDVGGTPFLVRDGETGRLVAPRDPVSLAAALEDVLMNPALAAELASRARARVELEFSPPAMGQAYVDLYREVIDVGRSARRSTGRSMRRQLASL